MRRTGSEGDHRFHPSILREYDVRGIVGETLSAADATALGRAFATIVRAHGGQRVCVGMDGRLSSPELAEAAVEGVRASGVEVLWIGRGPTPMLYFAVHHHDADGGIQITGSHNPPAHNGFKMMLGKKSFFGAQIQELGRIAAARRLRKRARQAHRRSGVRRLCRAPGAGLPARAVASCRWRGMRATAPRAKR